MVDTERAIALLGRLVAFDTTSRHSNLDLVEFVEKLLAECGIPSRRVAGADPAKASLIASIGPAVAGGVVLSGHTDAVPVTGQTWSSDPFSLAVRGDRLYGRGTADMKGFIACVLAHAPGWSRAPLARPIHVVLSHDEEVGCLAQPALVTRLLESVPLPAVAIVGEPSEMRVADAHRGIHVFATEVTGRGGHSGAPEKGINAIVAAARCIHRLNLLGAGLPAAGHENGDEAGERTTINVGVFEGGHAVNIIPDRARFVWECRPADDRDAMRILDAFDGYVQQDLLPPLRRVAPEVAVTTEETIGVPPLRPDRTSAAVALALSLTDESACGRVPFVSEAGFFQRAGIPSVVCGPGSPEQAHQPDEFVSRGQLAACLAMLDRLASRLG